MNTQTQSSKTMNIIIWIAQTLVAVFFLATGVSHLTMPLEKLIPMASWVKDVSLSLVRFIGFAEFLGGIGLLLPSLLRIKPQLSFWAAIGLTTIMLLAIIFHVSRGEGAMIGIHIILLLLLAFAAWGRRKKAVIQSR